MSSLNPPQAASSMASGPSVSSLSGMSEFSSGASQQQQYEEDIRTMLRQTAVTPIPESDETSQSSQSSVPSFSFSTGDSTDDSFSISRALEATTRKQPGKDDSAKPESLATRMDQKGDEKQAEHKTISTVSARDVAKDVAKLSEWLAQDEHTTKPDTDAEDRIQTRPNTSNGNSNIAVNAEKAPVHKNALPLSPRQAAEHVEKLSEMIKMVETNQNTTTPKKGEMPKGPSPETEAANPPEETLVQDEARNNNAQPEDVEENEEPPTRKQPTLKISIPNPHPLVRESSQSSLELDKTEDRYATAAVSPTGCESAATQETSNPNDKKNLSKNRSSSEDKYSIGEDDSDLIMKMKEEKRPRKSNASQKQETKHKKKNLPPISPSSKRNGERYAVAAPKSDPRASDKKTYKSDHPASPKAIYRDRHPITSPPDSPESCDWDDRYAIHSGHISPLSDALLSRRSEMADESELSLLDEDEDEDENNHEEVNAFTGHSSKHVISPDSETGSSKSGLMILSDEEIESMIEAESSSKSHYIPGITLKPRFQKNEAAYLQETSVAQDENGDESRTDSLPDERKDRSQRNQTKPVIPATSAAIGKRNETKQDGGNREGSRQRVTPLHSVMTLASSFLGKKSQKTGNDSARDAKEMDSVMAVSPKRTASKAPNLGATEQPTSPSSGDAFCGAKLGDQMMEPMRGENGEFRVPPEEFDFDCLPKEQYQELCEMQKNGKSFDPSVFLMTAPDGSAVPMSPAHETSFCGAFGFADNHIPTSNAKSNLQYPNREHATSEKLRHERAELQQASPARSSQLLNSEENRDQRETIGGQYTDPARTQPKSEQLEKDDPFWDGLSTIASTMELRNACRPVGPSMPEESPSAQADHTTADKSRIGKWICCHWKESSRGKGNARDSDGENKTRTETNPENSTMVDSEKIPEVISLTLPEDFSLMKKKREQDQADPDAVANSMQRLQSILKEDDSSTQSSLSYSRDSGTADAEERLHDEVKEEEKVYTTNSKKPKDELGGSEVADKNLARRPARYGEDDGEEPLSSPSNQGETTLKTRALTDTTNPVLQSDESAESDGERHSEVLLGKYLEQTSPIHQKTSSEDVLLSSQDATGSSRMSSDGVTSGSQVENDNDRINFSSDSSEDNVSSLLLSVTRTDSDLALAPSLKRGGSSSDDPYNGDTDNSGSDGEALMSNKVITLDPLLPNLDSISEQPLPFNKDEVQVLRRENEATDQDRYSPNLGYKAPSSPDWNDTVPFDEADQTEVNKETLKEEVGIIKSTEPIPDSLSPLTEPAELDQAEGAVGKKDMEVIKSKESSAEFLSPLTEPTALEQSTGTASNYDPAIDEVISKYDSIVRKLLKKNMELKDASQEYLERSPSIDSIEMEQLLTEVRSKTKHNGNPEKERSNSIDSIELEYLLGDMVPRKEEEETRTTDPSHPETYLDDYVVFHFEDRSRGPPRPEELSIERDYRSPRARHVAAPLKSRPKSPTRELSTQAASRPTLPALKSPPRYSSPSRANHISPTQKRQTNTMIQPAPESPRQGNSPSRVRSPAKRRYDLARKSLERTRLLRYRKSDTSLSPTIGRRTSPAKERLSPEKPRERSSRKNRSPPKRSRRSPALILYPMDSSSDEAATTDSLSANSSPGASNHTKRPERKCYSLSPVRVRHDKQFSQHMKKARELRKQLDLARFTSHSIRRFHASLLVEMNTFKHKLHQHAKSKKGERALLVASQNVLKSYQDKSHQKKKVESQDGKAKKGGGSGEFEDVRHLMLRNLKLLNEAQHALAKKKARAAKVDNSKQTEEVVDEDANKLKEIEKSLDELVTSESITNEVVIKCLDNAKHMIRSSSPTPSINSASSSMF